MNHKRNRILASIAAVVGAAGIATFLYWFISPQNAVERQGLTQVLILGLGGIGAVGGLYLTWRTLLNTRELEKERAEEAALQKYFEQMGRLFTEPDLRGTGRIVARAQTFAVLEGLDDPVRKRILLQFLYELDLIKKDAPVISLSRAPLNEADLSYIDLPESSLRDARLIDAEIYNADLRKADLSKAFLIGAVLNGSDLSGADLRGAALDHTEMSDADFSGADLTGVMDLTQEQIDAALGDKRTKLPDYLERPKRWSERPEEP